VDLLRRFYGRENPFAPDGKRKIKTDKLRTEDDQ
jgi:hypothetical protein